MTNRLNNFDKSCCQSHTSFVFAQLFPSCTKIQYHFPSISGKMKINTSTQLCYKLQLLSKRWPLYSLYMFRLNLCSKFCCRKTNHWVRDVLAHEIRSSQELICHNLIPSLLLLETKPNTPLPTAPGLPSRHPSLSPFLCHVSLQLHGECGFPLKFPCCLALYWLSPIVVYHQHIWQVHSWFLPCRCCWLENKRGFIEPSPCTHLLPCSHSALSSSFGGGLSLDFSFNRFG